MDIVNLDIAQFAILAAVIAGVTELITRLRAKDYWVVATIVSAVAVGALFGALQYAGVNDIGIGVALGFAASGTLQTVSMFGNKSTRAPSGVLERKK